MWKVQEEMHFCPSLNMTLTKVILTKEEPD